jgi:hypothetical protein
MVVAAVACFFCKRHVSLPVAPETRIGRDARGVSDLPVDHRMFVTIATRQFDLVAFVATVRKRNVV